VEVDGALDRGAAKSITQFEEQRGIDGSLRAHKNW
jgi:hypothetical protein